MERENNKKNKEIDEQYLMSMMSGGVREGGFSNKIISDSGPADSEVNINKKRKNETRGKEVLSYEALFFKNMGSSARNGKSVYIRPEFHERLTRIVRVIGEDKISLYTYLDNVLEYHFKEFGEQIRKSFDDKYKPIF